MKRKRYNAMEEARIIFGPCFHENESLIMTRMMVDAGAKIARLKRALRYEREQHEKAIRFWQGLIKKHYIRKGGQP